MQSQIADLYLSRLSDLAHSYAQPFPAASLVYGCIRIDRNPRAPLALDLPASATYARRVRSCLLSLKLAIRSDDPEEGRQSQHAYTLTLVTCDPGLLSFNCPHHSYPTSQSITFRHSHVPSKHRLFLQTSPRPALSMFCIRHPSEFVYNISFFLSRRLLAQSSHVIQCRR